MTKQSALAEPTEPTAPTITGARRRHRHPLLLIVRLLHRTVLALVLLALAFVLVGAKTGRWHVTPVLSGSMEPTMPTGSLAVVEPVPTAELAVGDILLFRAPTPGHPTVLHRIAHRLEGRDGVRYNTKGDNNNAEDPWAIKIGTTTSYRVRTSVPALGFLAVASRNPRARVGLLLMSVMGILLTALFHIWSSDVAKRDAELDAAPLAADDPDLQHCESVRV